jgi:predicted nucleic acid-binding protein
MIVVDCSYTMAMVMPDERRPRSTKRAASGRLIAPALWPMEVANALRNVVRRGRLGEPEVAHVCNRLDAYEIEVHGAGDGSVRQRYLAALTHDLTAYDAAYLELALQRRCALATLDEHLAEAAERAGVAVLD